MITLNFPLSLYLRPMKPSSATGKKFTKAGTKAFILVAVSLWLAHPGPSFAGECQQIRAIIDPPVDSKRSPEFAKLPEGSMPLEEDWCRKLTDKSKNNGLPLTLRQLEEARQELKIKWDVKTIMGSLQASLIDKLVDCMIAGAHIVSCTCIATKLPMKIDYTLYTAITSSKPWVNAELFKITQSDFIKLAGVVWGVRDECFASNNVWRQR